MQLIFQILKLFDKSRYSNNNNNNILDELYRMFEKFKIQLHTIFLKSTFYQFIIIIYCINPRI